MEMNKMILTKKPLKVLLIGGTGTISLPICEALSQNQDIELYVMNRGHKSLPEHAHQIICDFHDTAKMEEILKDYSFDIVCNFIIYKPEEAIKQIQLFKGKIQQYIFISTVVTYNHETAVMIHESHEQNNIYSEYGREKTKCEQIFMKAYEEFGFPITIVRPSQTYGYDRIPLSVKGKSCWSVVDRILNDKPVIVHGDGKSTWHCTHNQDFAYNFIQLINNEKTIGQAYHNINPVVVNWDMIYRDLYALLNKEPKIIHIASDTLALSQTYDIESSILGDKQYSCLFDMSKIQRDIPDFQNHIMIQEGLKMYLDYMEQYPEKKVKDETFDQWCDQVIDAYQKFIQEIKGHF